MHHAAVVVGSLLLRAAPITMGPGGRYRETHLDTGIGPAGWTAGTLSSYLLLTFARLPYAEATY